LNIYVKLQILFTNSLWRHIGSLSFQP
jgi:hypothetical protein